MASHGLTPSDPVSEAVGFVLAGGQSSRMGQDKALLPFAGTPLIVRAISILRKAGLQPSIAGARSASLAAYAHVIADAKPEQGPLAGICAALASTTARHTVFLPIDLPLLPASLIEYLLRHARITGSAVTASTVSGFTHTFPVVLDHVVLPALQCELDAGRRGCFAAFEAAAANLRQPIVNAPVELLVQCGQVAHPLGLAPFHWFLNVNRPADLERAQALYPQGIA